MGCSQLYCSIPEADGLTCTASLLVFASWRRRLSADQQLGLQAPRDFQCSLAGAWLQTILFTVAIFVTDCDRQVI